MNIQSSCLSISLLASLWAGGAAPAIAAPLSSTSAFPISPAALAQQICGEDPSERKILVDCIVTIPNGAAAPREAEGLHLMSTEPMMTPCGLWDARLSLGTRTRVHLANRETGQNAGFALLRGPDAADPWLLVPIGESPKLVLHAGAREEGDEDEVIRFEGCIPAWVLKDPDMVIDPENQCEICPEDDRTGGGDSDDSDDSDDSQAVPVDEP